jgi:hypothetical protein
LQAGGAAEVVHVYTEYSPLVACIYTRELAAIRPIQHQDYVRLM